MAMSFAVKGRGAAPAANAVVAPASRLAATAKPAAHAAMFSLSRKIAPPGLPSATIAV